MNILEIIVWLFVIVQQPVNSPLYVSDQPGEVTHFEEVENYDVYGLLAHDYLAGGNFYNLNYGDELYANGYEFSVTDIRYYDASVTDEEIFDEVYTIPDRLILQTCYGNGFMFVVGEPTGNYNNLYDGELVFVKDAIYNFMFEFLEK